MTVTQEVERRIKLIESALHSLPRWRLLKRRRYAASLRNYRRHLEEVKRDEIVEKVMNDPSLAERAVIDILASPAAFDS